MPKLVKVRQKIIEALERSHRSLDVITLVAVSKGCSSEEIMKLYQRGIRDFGENRVDEARMKQALLPADIRWHFIGSLQSNKTRQVVGHFALIHSVDRLELARKIDAISAAQGEGIVTDILLQVNTSNEPSKHGLTAEELEQYFPQFMELSHLRVCGLMTMGPRLHPGDEIGGNNNVRCCFRQLRELKEKLCLLYPEVRGSFTELSMGMSQDFEAAIEEGATMLRIGSALFM